MLRSRSPIAIPLRAAASSKAEPMSAKPHSVRFARPGPALHVVVVEDSQGRAVEVVVLVIAQGPEEAEQPDQAEKQSQRNEIDQHRHAATSAGDGVGRAVDGVRNARGRARTALTVTVTDETDMATAAISGVTTPNTASGTAAAL